MKWRDRGPWSLMRDRDSNDVVGVISDDFTHDVVLYVNGDFADQADKEHYTAELMKVLNSE